MRREAYAAARTISPKLQGYFARQREEAQRRGQKDLAPLPDAETIEAMIDASFWASLRREEGYVPRISLAYACPEQAPTALLLETPLPLNPVSLTRVSPAVERPGTHLGVWRVQGDLCVWGAMRNIPVLAFVLEVAAPGLLVVKHHSGNESRKFINVAVLEGDQIKVVEEPSGGETDFQPLRHTLLEFDGPSLAPKSVNTLVQLGVSMRAHGRGGSLLIVPLGTDAWRESVVQPVPYAVAPPFRQLADLSEGNGDFGPEKKAALDVIVGSIAGLTAVDGAVLLNDRYELLGFGAKIIRRKGSPLVEQVALTEPIKGAEPAVVRPEQLGGTRHLSAVQFIHDQRDSLALVASQDGRVTIFGWSQRQQMVQAHRVDVLLF